MKKILGYTAAATAENIVIDIVHLHTKQIIEIF